MRLQTTKQLKNNTNIETLQPTKTNDNCKVSKNGHTTNEDKNKQIHSQLRYKKVRIHREIFLSDYFMKHSLMHSSLHLV